MALQVEVQYNSNHDHRRERQRLARDRGRTELIINGRTTSPYRLLVHALDRLDWSVTTVSPFGITGIGIFSVYYAALSYGTIVIWVVDGSRLLDKVSPMMVLVGLPLVPVSLITLEAIDIEDRVLVLWRQKIMPLFMAKIPLVGGILNYYWPEMTRQPIISKPSGVSSTMDYITRCVISGLSLPFIAHFAGKILFSCKYQSSLQRTVLVSWALFWLNYQTLFFFI